MPIPPPPEKTKKKKKKQRKETGNLDRYIDNWSINTYLCTETYPEHNRIK